MQASHRDFYFEDTPPVARNLLSKYLIHQSDNQEFIELLSKRAAVREMR